MRIAQVAPLYESCPPKLYGGTERVVSWLTEELVAMGHKVSLYAAGDSVTKARLVPGCRQALRLDPSVVDPLTYHVVMIDKVLEDASQYDVIHFHTDYLHYSAFTRCHVPSLTTLHGRQDMPDLPPVYNRFASMPLVSISDAQRSPMPWANWIDTVHHGLPPSLLHAGPGDGGYLAFIGRISPEKGLDRAIQIAQAVGMPLKVAAKIDKADKAYFETAIAPLLSGPGIQFIGEIGDREKQDFLGKAAALLFPIAWPEPFGLVMIEANACGTPVLAFRHGSVPEVIEPGLNGFVVDTVTEAVAVLPRLLELDRHVIRGTFEKRFTARRMAEDYVRLYEHMTHVRTKAPVVPLFPAATRASASQN